MNEHHIVRSMLLRMGRGHAATSSIAKTIMEWAQPHCAWLLPGAGGDEEPGWDALMADLAEPAPVDTARPHVLVLASELADMLDLAPFDRALLTLMVACTRIPRVASLADIAMQHGQDLPTVLGTLAGSNPNDAERMVRQSTILRLGLVSFSANWQGRPEVVIEWPLERLLDRAPTTDAGMVDALVGPAQGAALALDDFGHVADADFLVRLLRGAADAGAAGINILIHGPPGTGKTEFARTLAAAAGVTLHGVAEVQGDDDEPSRRDRVRALGLAQRLLGRRQRAALLFDEMEDIIGDSERSSGDWFARRVGSKLFVNRMLETNPAPVIWTTNAIGNIDDAILRRMSFVLTMTVPSRRAALRMLDRIASDEGVAVNDSLIDLIDRVPETASVLRVAARSARLANDTDGGTRAASSLVRALRGGELPLPAPGTIDLDLFDTDRALEPLFEAMRKSDSPDVSLLLTGPPGTGKTALAHHLARTLDRPLVVKRASDLLSKWVGQTEAQIAAAFAEARRQEGVLLFDEADSLLLDRSRAHNAWEVGQVNELLTWLDRHPYPVVAATNHPGSLDPASLRRFVFKLDLRPLGRDRAASAFARFFGCAAPAALAELTELTPGDFAVVARQLRYAPARDATDIVERLRQECLAKPGRAGRVGF